MTAPDYIVVGAGSAGCVIAGRLSQAGHRVVLVEAGPPARLIWTKIPIGYGKTFYDPRVNWMFQTEPVPGFGGRSSYWPRGKVVGGSSSINAMVYSRGQPADYDAWEAAGNTGWGWDAVLAAYRRIEDHALGASPRHGSGGPLHVTLTEEHAHPLSRAFISACAEIGLPYTSDLNGESIEGAGYYQITTRDGLRESAATAFLRPSPNLRVLTNRLVERIAFDGRRATGVVLSGPGGSEMLAAGRAVVLCAGSIGSPTVLMRSGVGPAAHLAALGIPVVDDKPDVGRNLSDHLCHDLVWRTRIPSLNQVLQPFLGRVRVGLRYLLTRSGPLALSLNQAGGFYRSAVGARVPDMQLYFSPLTYERAPKGVRPLMSPDPFPGVCASISPCKPFSRGSIALSAPDPAAPPVIRPGYLDDPRDMAPLVAGVRYLRRIAEAPALRQAIEMELKPGAPVETDEALAADIRARAYSVFHPTGTCRMGPDPGSSVVGPGLALHGFSGLYVADASIMPEITSGNTNAPAMMIGEMAAERLLRV